MKFVLFFTLMICVVGFVKPQTKDERVRKLFKAWCVSETFLIFLEIATKNIPKNFS